MESSRSSESSETSRSSAEQSSRPTETSRSYLGLLTPEIREMILKKAEGTIVAEATAEEKMIRYRMWTTKIRIKQYFLSPISGKRLSMFIEGYTPLDDVKKAIRVMKGEDFDFNRRMGDLIVIIDREDDVVFVTSPRTLEPGLVIEFDSGVFLRLLEEIFDIAYNNQSLPVVTIFSDGSAIRTEKDRRGVIRKSLML